MKASWKCDGKTGGYKAYKKGRYGERVVKGYIRNKYVLMDSWHAFELADSRLHAMFPI
jgi:hypothetical protein